MNVPIAISLFTLIVSSCLVFFLIVTFKPKDKGNKDYDKKDTKC
jgi:hypothetical protein